MMENINTWVQVGMGILIFQSLDQRETSRQMEEEIQVYLEKKQATLQINVVPTQKKK